MDAVPGPKLLHASERRRWERSPQQAATLARDLPLPAGDPVVAIALA